MIGRRRQDEGQTSNRRPTRTNVRGKMMTSDAESAAATTRLWTEEKYDELATRRRSVLAPPGRRSADDAAGRR